MSESVSVDQALIEDLVVHRDERGFLVELFKGEWGQITLVEIGPHTRRGGHKHLKTNEIWVFVRGEGIARLESPDGIREMYTVGSRNVFPIQLPAGTGHDVANTGDEPLWLIYFADMPYNPEDPDVVAWSWEGDVE